MARRRSARHARPTGRGALAAAYTTLEGDVARLRSTGYSDHLELIRLTALVDGLVAQITRLGMELAEMRRELHAARAVPAPADPRVELLTAQVSELHATVATQQAMLADLTRRVLDLLTHLEVQATAVAVASAAPPAPSPVPSAPPAYAPAPAPAPAAPAADPASLRPESAVSRAPVPRADDALDDETVLRLRLIRESFGR
jgi:outer membrane murein-binding lipoprotein Lpp